MGAGSVPRSDDRNSAVKVLAACFLLACSSVHAGSFYDGNKLLQLMNSDVAYERGVAMGYVAGVLDLGDGILFCTPTPPITTGQGRDVVKQYLEQNPAIRNNVANDLLVGLFRKLWPCPVTKRNSGVSL